MQLSTTSGIACPESLKNKELRIYWLVNKRKLDIYLSTVYKHSGLKISVI